jgi:hypothetical protein
LLLGDVPETRRIVEQEVLVFCFGRRRQVIIIHW